MCSRMKRRTKRSITIAHAGKQNAAHGNTTARRRFAARPPKKEEKKGKNDDDNPQDGATAFYRAILDAPRKTRPKFSEEEARRNFEIGARYNKLSRIKLPVRGRAPAEARPAAVRVREPPPICGSRR